MAAKASLVARVEMCLSRRYLLRAIRRSPQMRGLAHGLLVFVDRLMFAAEDDPARFIVEGAVGGKVYRLVFALAGPDLVYPITAFRIAPSRRRKA